MFFELKFLNGYNLDKKKKRNNMISFTLCQI